MSVETVSTTPVSTTPVSATPVSATPVSTTSAVSTDVSSPQKGLLFGRSALPLSMQAIRDDRPIKT